MFEIHLETDPMNSAMDESLLATITDHLVTEAANFDGSNADGTCN